MFASRHRQKFVSLERSSKAVLPMFRWLYRANHCTLKKSKTGWVLQHAALARTIARFSISLEMFRVPSITQKRYNILRATLVD